MASRSVGCSNFGQLFLHHQNADVLSKKDIPNDSMQHCKTNISHRSDFCKPQKTLANVRPRQTWGFWEYLMNPKTATTHEYDKKKLSNEENFPPFLTMLEPALFRTPACLPPCSSHSLKQLIIWVVLTIQSALSTDRSNTSCDLMRLHVLQKPSFCHPIGEL